MDLLALSAQIAGRRGLCLLLWAALLTVGGASARSPIFRASLRPSSRGIDAHADNGRPQKQSSRWQGRGVALPSTIRQWCNNGGNARSAIAGIMATTCTVVDVARPRHRSRPARRLAGRKEGLPQVQCWLDRSTPCGAAVAAKERTGPLACSAGNAGRQRRSPRQTRLARRRRR